MYVLPHTECRDNKKGKMNCNRYSNDNTGRPHSEQEIGAPVYQTKNIKQIKQIIETIPAHVEENKRKRLSNTDESEKQYKKLKHYDGTSIEKYVSRSIKGEINRSTLKNALKKF